MRQFNFRAWITTLSAGKLKKPQMTEMDTATLFSWKSDSDNDLILMESTGITDKNGKEIYESDIVRVKMIPNEYEVFQVAWNWSGARFGLVDQEGEDWAFTASNDIEVIGNIYANPDLFKSNGTEI